MKSKRPEIKLIYNSRHDNVVDDFFNNVLSYFKNYDRVSAYFDSKILYLYSRGLKNILKNNGKIRFIFSDSITEEDYNLIIKGYTNKEKYAEERIKEVSKGLIDDENISNLAYLISIGIVDIKIALTSSGIFHDKFGLIYNDEDTVLFRGSANETTAAIKHNYDSFETSVSWKESDKNIIEYRKQNFELLWNNNEHGTIVIDVQELAKKHLLRFNKGRIVSAYDNTIYFDFQSELIMYNYLNNKNDFDIKNYYYKTNIEYHVDKIKETAFTFKEGRNYHEINKIIKKVELFGEKENFKVFINPKVLEYVENRKYEINRMKSLGVAIKNKTINEFQLLEDKFRQFQMIIDRDMERKLMEPQKMGAFHLAQLIKSSNFSVPGSGKTTTVYATYAYLSSQEINKIDKIVMVGPLNSFNSWIEEFYACFGSKKELNFFDISEYEDKNNALKWETYNKNLILMNYEMLLNLDNENFNIIDNRTLLVFDEIHRIKKVNGKRANIAIELSRYANYIVALTGTPIPNGYEDLYNLLNILYRDDYDYYFKFNVQQLKEAKNSQRMIETINENIYPFFIRTTKKELNIPPPKKDIIDEISTTMTGDEQRIFKIIYPLFRHNTLLLYLRLLQASLNPSLILNSLNISELDLDEYNLPESYVSNFGKEKITKYLSDDEINLIKNHGPTSKFYKGIDLILDLVSQNKTVLVWAVFIDNLNLIYNELIKRDIKAGLIYGNVDLVERDKIINMFKNKKIDVLIANPHTISESISLHHACHDAIYFEYTFNLTHMLQSKDRINRLGLDSGQYTQYYYLTLCGNNYEYDSIDRKTYDRLKMKEKLMIDAIEGEMLFSTPFDDLKEDINYIFGKNETKK